MLQGRQHADAISAGREAGRIICRECGVTCPDLNNLKHAALPVHWSQSTAEAACGRGTSFRSRSGHPLHAHIYVERQSEASVLPETSTTWDMRCAGQADVRVTSATPPATAPLHSQLTFANVLSGRANLAIRSSTAQGRLSGIAEQVGIAYLIT